MSNTIKNMTTEERLDTSKEYLEAIADRIDAAINLNEMCEHIIFSKHLVEQIPTSYAANSYNFLQDTLIRQLALTLCTLWDKPSIDRMSFPTIFSLIDSNVINSSFSYEHINKVITRKDRFSNCTLIKNTMDLRDLELAHHLNKDKVQKNSIKTPEINWDYPKKLLSLSIWCCHNLAHGLHGHDFSFDEIKRIAYQQNYSLWHHCSFNIPDEKNLLADY